MKTIGQTIDLIRDFHENQFDKGGFPYWTHPVRVMGMLPLGSGETEQHAALLHDVMEDCGVTRDQLRVMGYTNEVINIIELVTRKKGDGLTYMEWIRRIAESGNIGAIRVKIADNWDNSNPLRIAQLPEESRSIAHRYERSIGILYPALQRYEQATKK